MALSERRPTRITVYRSHRRPAGYARFQPEWEPISDPYTDDPGAEARRTAASPEKLAPNLPRLPRALYPALSATALTVALTGVVSLGPTIKTSGLTPQAAAFWLAAWQQAALIAIPARFLLAPLVSKLITLLVEPPAPQANAR